MRNYIAELTGTFALVFCGTGSVIINQQSGGVITHVGIAITFGLVIMSVIYAIGNISGAHLNPAVSIALAVARRFSAKELVPYIISQVAGAFLASCILKYLFPLNDTLGATLPSGAPMQSFILEIIMTFLLMLVIVNVATGSKEQGMFAGLAIGGTVALDIMFAGPVTGGSMNPARSLAPAVVSGHTEHLWIYMIAPVLGAILAIPIWKYTTARSAA